MDSSETRAPDASKESKTALSERIANLQAAKAVLPATEGFFHSNLDAQIADLKSQIIQLKPLESQISGLEACIMRQNARRDEQLAKVYEAQAAVDALTTEIASNQAKLQTLKLDHVKAIGVAPPSPIAPSAVEFQLQQLQTAMSAIGTFFGSMPPDSYAALPDHLKQIHTHFAATGGQPPTVQHVGVSESSFGPSTAAASHRTTPYGDTEHVSAEGAFGDNDEFPTDWNHSMLPSISPLEDPSLAPATS